MKVNITFGSNGFTLLQEVQASSTHVKLTILKIYYPHEHERKQSSTDWHLRTHSFAHKLDT